MSDSRTIAEVIKSQTNKKQGAPELVWDEESQTFIAVPEGKAKDTGKPNLTKTATDVFYGIY
jgi:hypothetical protein